VESFPILGNSGQLGQLFLNLISNALEAAGPGGSVQVQISREEAREPLCRVEVIDSGPGPPVHLAERLFEPFVTGKPDGVGLGLALARQVTEAHGGRIGWARSDQHTRFFVELPLQIPAMKMTTG
jgi:signal transduction histidine kinase